MHGQTTLIISKRLDTFERKGLRRKFGGIKVNENWIK